MDIQKKNYIQNLSQRGPITDDVEDNLEDVNQLREGKIDKISMEKRYVNKNGDTIWAHTDVVALRKKSGELDYFIAMVNDITEQKVYEDSLRESEAALKAAQKLAGIGNWQWDLEEDRPYLVGRNISHLWP